MVAGPPSATTTGTSSYQHHQHHQNHQQQQHHHHFYAANNSNEQHGIRDVWAGNLEAEMATICRLVSRYPYVAMDTEFPGVVGRPSVGVGALQGASGRQHQAGSHHTFVSRADYAYQSMRVNVNMLKLIQLGLTLMDEQGRTPPGGISTWQFNFHFSLASDMYQESSIRLLTKAGITFSRHDAEGVDPRHFAALLTASGLVLREEVTWLSFHSGYDFGYLLRMLTGAAELPPTIEGFFDLLRVFFPRLYDLKFLVGVANKRCTFYEAGKVVDSPHLAIVKGGLSEIAKQIGIPRKGASHQAGSDSLLTGEAFFKVRRLFFGDDLEAAERYDENKRAAAGSGSVVVPFLGTIYGLKVGLSGSGSHDVADGVRFSRTARSNSLGSSHHLFSASPSPPLEEDELEMEETETETETEAEADEVEEVEDEVEVLLQDVVDEVAVDEEKTAAEEVEAESEEQQTSAVVEEKSEEK